MGNFSNITYQGIGENKSVIFGYDNDRKVRNVTFDNIVINGEKIENTQDFLINEFVENVTIK